MKMFLLLFFNFTNASQLYIHLIYAYFIIHIYNYAMCPAPYRTGGWRGVTHPPQDAHLLISSGKTWEFRAKPVCCDYRVFTILSGNFPIHPPEWYAFGTALHVSHDKKNLSLLSLWFSPIEHSYLNYMFY